MFVFCGRMTSARRQFLGGGSQVLRHDLGSRTSTFCFCDSTQRTAWSLKRVPNVFAQLQQWLPECGLRICQGFHFLWEWTYMPGMTGVGQICQCELGKPQKGLGSEETISVARQGMRIGCRTYPSGNTLHSNGEHWAQVGLAMVPFCFGEGCVNALERNKKSYQFGCCFWTCALNILEYSWLKRTSCNCFPEAME